ncbi:hypothetical protein R84B8_02540 [Treponema sp. R8-4-B8]
MDFSIVEIKDVETKQKYIDELRYSHKEISINYELQSLIPNSSTAFFAAFDDKKLIGLVDGYIRSSCKKDVGYIWDYIILSKYKEMDIANTLFTAIKKYFIEKQCDRIIVAFPYFNDEERDNNIYEYQLYSKNGFRDIEIYEDLRPTSEYFNYRRMIKFL